MLLAQVLVDGAGTLVYASSRPVAEPNQKDGIKKVAGRVSSESLRGDWAPHLPAKRWL
jgi:hypothetical protein